MVTCLTFLPMSVGAKKELVEQLIVVNVVVVVKEGVEETVEQGQDDKGQKGTEQSVQDDDLGRLLLLGRVGFALNLTVLSLCLQFLVLTFDFFSLFHSLALISYLKKPFGVF